jgi:hypothetical protein
VAQPEALDKAIAYLDKVVALKPMDSAGYVNKRIALMKYMEYEQLQMAAAQRMQKRTRPSCRSCGRKRTKRKRNTESPFLL